MITRARISRIGRKLCNVTLDSSFSWRENFNLSEFWRPQAFYDDASSSPRLMSRKFKRSDREKQLLPLVDVRGELSTARTALQGNQSGPRLIFLPLGATHGTRHLMFHSSFILRDEATFGIRAVDTPSVSRRLIITLCLLIPVLWALIKNIRAFVASISLIIKKRN